MYSLIIYICNIDKPARGVSHSTDVIIHDVMGLMEPVFIVGFGISETPFISMTRFVQLYHDAVFKSGLYMYIIYIIGPIFHFFLFQQFKI